MKKDDPLTSAALDFAGLPAPVGKDAKAATQRTDAAEFDVTPRTIRNWRAAGAPGFRPDGTIDDKPALRAWVAKQEDGRAGSSRGIEAERDQRIRKLKVANDRAEGLLIPRADIVARFQLAAGERAEFRAKSIQEHAKLFAAAAGDEAKCREILRGVIWPKIDAIELACSDHFKDPKKK